MILMPVIFGLSFKSKQRPKRVVPCIFYCHCSLTRNLNAFIFNQQKKSFDMRINGVYARNGTNNCYWE